MARIIIKDYAKKLINLSAGDIIRQLELKTPLYAKTARYGHFGNPYYPWEEIMLDFKFEDNDTFDIELMDDIEDKRISNFILNQIPIYLDECDIANDTIIFSFMEEYQTANESNNQNEYLSITITYDLKTECFSNYEQEQG